MAGETVITVVGNLTADPELRHTNNGVALASFTIASTPKIYDRQSNEWRDGEALFLRCTVWREYAENVVNSLTKGARVIARGNLKQRNYETKEGERRTSYELEVDEIGPSLRFATAQINRSQPRGSSPFAAGGSAPVESSSSEQWSRGGGASDGWANPGQSFDDADAPF